MRLGRHFDQDEREGSLGFDRTKTAKCVPGAWKVRILGLGLGQKTSLGEAAGSGSNVARVPNMKIPYCIFVPFKDTLVGK